LKTRRKPLSDEQKLTLRTAVVVGLGTTLFYLAFLSPVIYAVDGISMLAVSESLVTHGGLTVPKAMGIAGLGGFYYSKWYPLLSFLALPLVALGMTFAHLMHLPPHFMAAVFALILSPVLIGATTGVVVMLASRLGASRRGSILAAIAYAFGTVALVYAREFYAEPLLALITVVAIYLELGSQRKGSMVAACAALAVLAKPTGVVLGLVLAMHAALKDRSLRSTFAPLVGTAAGLGIYFYYNYIRFGEALNFGRSITPSLSYLPAGLAGLLASPGRGLVWYCPVVLALAGLSAKLWKRLDVMLIASIALAYLGIYAVSGGDWTGGWCWGPRYLLPALPGLIALCGLLVGTSRKALVMLTMLGFMINAPTLISYYERLYAEEMAAQEQPDQWSLTGAPFVRVWGSAWRELDDARRTDVRLLVQHAGESENSEVSSWKTFRIVPLWWWMLPLAGIPRAVGAALSAILALAGLGLIWWTWSWGAETPGTPSVT
jgi:hypothetical protein